MGIGDDLKDPPSKTDGRCCYYGCMTSVPPHLGIDATASAGRIAAMIRRLIHGAMRSSLQELLEPALTDLKASIKHLQEGQNRLGLRLDSTNERLDSINSSLSDRIGSLDVKIDAMGNSLGARIDAVNNSLGARIETINESLSARMDLLSGNVEAVDHSLSGRMDALNGGLGSRTDSMSASLNGRIDESTTALTAKIDGVMVQQIQLIKEVAALHRDKVITTDILSRLGRLEDRMPAKAV
jgi:hypothetical protein